MPEVGKCHYAECFNLGWDGGVVGLWNGPGGHSIGKTHG